MTSCYSLLVKGYSLSQYQCIVFVFFFLCSCATSHSFPVSADGGCYYPPTMLLRVLLFYLHRADDDYRRLIVYGCEHEAQRGGERERERKKKK